MMTVGEVIARLSEYPEYRRVHVRISGHDAHPVVEIEDTQEGYTTPVVMLFGETRK